MRIVENNNFKKIQKSDPKKPSYWAWYKISLVFELNKNLSENFWVLK